MLYVDVDVDVVVDVDYRLLYGYLCDPEGIHMLVMGEDVGPEPISDTQFFSLGKTVSSSEKFM